MTEIICYYRDENLYNISTARDGVAVEEEKSKVLNSQYDVPKHERL
jgi:hypothetical protein